MNHIETVLLTYIFSAAFLGLLAEIEAFFWTKSTGRGIQWYIRHPLCLALGAMAPAIFVLVILAYIGVPLELYLAAFRRVFLREDAA